MWTVLTGQPLESKDTDCRSPIGNAIRQNSCEMGTLTESTSVKMLWAWSRKWSLLQIFQSRFVFTSCFQLPAPNSRSVAWIGFKWCSCSGVGGGHCWLGHLSRRPHNQKHFKWKCLLMHCHFISWRFKEGTYPGLQSKPLIHRNVNGFWFQYKDPNAADHPARLGHRITE